MTDFRNWDFLIWAPLVDTGRITWCHNISPRRSSLRRTYLVLSNGTGNFKKRYLEGVIWQICAWPLSPAIDLGGGDKMSHSPHHQLFMILYDGGADLDNFSDMNLTHSVKNLNVLR